MKPKSQRMARLLFLAALLLLSGVTGLFLDTQRAVAYSSYLGAAETQYPKLVGTKLDSCQLCHPSGGYALNPYAADYKNAGHNFAAIEQLDSDKDGFLNITEINALTFPGDATDKPVAAATNTPTPTATRPGPTSTFTLTPTATQPVPTATSTSTSVPPSVTPIASATPAPSATSPIPAGPTPTPIPMPAPVTRFAFLGSISGYPNTASRAGDWLVGGRTVHVTAITWLEQPGLLGQHSQVWVLGMRGAGGDVDATYVRILTQGETDDDSRPPTATLTPTRTPRASATYTPTRTPTATRRPATATPTGTLTRTPEPTDDDHTTR